MDIYNKESWRNDRTFNAQPGQEIAEEIYFEMMDCMPPETLPRDKARQALQDYGIAVRAGFLMGEPHSTGKHGEDYYMAFGMNSYGKGKHYYYLGLAEPAPKLQDGDYYYFDCMNADINDQLYSVNYFTGDAEAIRSAANYEATLYRHTYKDGQRVKSETLYEPQYQ